MQSPFVHFNHLKPLLGGRIPGQLVIQYSNLCNADCPQCGMRRSETIPRFTLNKDRVKKLIDEAACKGIKSLSFTGGEPLMFFEDIVELINHASQAGIPYIRTGTNGFLFRKHDAPGFTKDVTGMAERLAATKLYTFWMSLDSAEPDDHESLRGLKGVIKGIEKALPIFHDHGIYPAVNLGINRAMGGRLRQPFLSETAPDEFLAVFRDSFERFYQCVLNLGFTMVNACYPMSTGTAENTPEGRDSAPYGAASGNSMITFSAAEKALIFKALYQTIPKFRGKLRIFSPRCSLFGLMRKFTDHQPALFSCRGGIDFFFVDCRKGMIHPCGYRDEPRSELPGPGKRYDCLINCDRCEWECFRDPSDILGPVADFFSQPLQLMRKMAGNPQYFRLLLEDLFYYRACGYFNGRLAPQFQAMKRFEKI